MSLKAIIIDDEEFARKNLQILLEEHCPDVDVVADADGKTEALEKIKEFQPDVLFLDIRMPSGSEGFELLEEIEDMNVLVVFVTAFKDYAIRAFNANAVYYLLKPIDIDELKTAVEKLIESKKLFSENPENYTTYFRSLKNLSDTFLRNKPNNRIAISHTKGLKIVEDDSIVNLEASGNCTMLHFSDGSRYLDTRTLKIYENLLDPNKFSRIHKSHIINLNYMTDYINEDGHFAVLKNSERIPIARNRVSEFVKGLKN
jgi:two-component system LytT family response regulator|tara:strand:- start:26290 stop:27063 length:774 start_codon:yes stop_codon:yes gene_type:complete